jgi:hypothetical protein
MRGLSAELVSGGGRVTFGLQLGLFADESVGAPLSRRTKNVAANTARAIAEFGHLIGRRAAWMRLYDIDNPPKRAKVFVEHRRCEGTIVRVAGSAFEYSPLLIVSADELEWWLPPELVTLIQEQHGRTE